MKPLQFFLLLSILIPAVLRAETPNIILVMTDDQGWGQMGYYNHPHLKTPNLDAMAANGLRFDRFYAGASNCSPTRATVMTGRSNDRTGVENHGYPLRLQEKTVAQALRDAGYATGHFGKWHLNGLRGAGAPILKEDTHNPGAFGFETWVSVTNFFDLNPILSRKGEFVEFEGDSSEIAIGEAIKFIETQAKAEKPFFAVVWFGTPHSPMRALEKDRAPFADLPEEEQHHLGELMAMDRSMGTLREKLRALGVAGDTLLWFNSDNGGLKGYGPETVGGLRGWKNTMHEGGLRVPGIIEWPGGIKGGRITEHPACTMDIFPTLADVVGLPEDAMVQPIDGISLKPLFTQDLERREQPIGFRHQNRGVLIDNNFKVYCDDLDKGKFELFNLEADPTESKDVSGEYPEVFDRLKSRYLAWNETVKASVAGKDYPEGKVDPNQPPRQFWSEVEAYKPYFEEWKKRPEFERYIK